MLKVGSYILDSEGAATFLICKVPDVKAFCSMIWSTNISVIVLHVLHHFMH